MNLRTLLTLAASTIPFTGCVGFVPSFSNKPYSGKPLTTRDTAFITAGKTTRAEVIQRLGGGYHESSNVSAIAYPCETPGGTWFAFIIMPYTAAGRAEALTRWRALFISFDARGVVTRHESVRLKTNVTLDEQLEAWAGWAPRIVPQEILP